MRYSQNILGLIGKTPLVKINQLTEAEGIKATVLAKMESLNPGYSVKDRIGISMIEDAEQKGLLKPGGTLIEATSGNTGIGLALAAAVKGYRCIFVVTDKVSQEKRNYLKSLGADIVSCPRAANLGAPDHYVETARRLAAETPNSFYPDQYNHAANPAAHYRTTGPEIWEDTDGQVTHFVSGIGTGGTISGAGRFLKEKNPAIRIIGADPYGSVFKTYKETGQMTEGTSYEVEGIGQNVIPGNADLKIIDEIINITDRESFDWSRQLSRVEGIFCGGSTGTNFAAALKVAKSLDEDSLVVFIVADTGEHYLSKHHSNEWMKEKRYLEPQKITAGLLCESKGLRNSERLVYVTPTETVAETLAKMNEHDVSQLPVLDEGRSVGSLRESHLLTKLLDNRDLMQSPVGEVMDASFPVATAESSVKEITLELHRSPAVLVEEYKRIIGIITRHDVLETGPISGR
jgi:cystathionine beta-synthase